MLIIIEGVDGAGKTSLVRKLERAIGTNTIVRHKGPPVAHPLVEYELDLESYQPGRAIHEICDRWHWGEAVYGPVLRGEDRLGIAGRQHVDLFLLARGAIVVHLTHFDSELQRRCYRENESLIALNMIPNLKQRYTQVANASLLPVLEYRDPGEGEVQVITMMAALAERAAYPLAAFRTYVGPPRPYYLILGEQRGPGQTKEAEHEAAFVPYPATSGRYLIESLPDFMLRHCGIANALEEDVHELWLSLGEPRIVTLGQRAHQHLSEQHIPHGAVPHPQYVRRFHHQHQTKYGRVIAQALLAQEDYTAWRP